MVLPQLFLKTAAMWVRLKPTSRLIASTVMRL